jgi:hypothetical protein
VTTRPETQASPTAPRHHFKVATEPWEFEEVARLNHATFAEEIPQREANERRLLFDALLERSVCIVCVEETAEGRAVVGMVAANGTRPFSLDAKLPDLDRYLPPLAKKLCEIRLLAIRRDRRGGAVFLGLARKLLSHYQGEGFDLALISAAASQAKLYRHLGFEPFGPPIGTPQAPYQAMMCAWNRLPDSARRLVAERQTEGSGA